MISIPVYTGDDSKIPAIVLDIENGQTWTISDIVSESAAWIKTDLPKEIKKEGYTSRY